MGADGHGGAGAEAGRVMGVRSRSAPGGSRLGGLALSNVTVYLFIYYDIGHSAPHAGW
jgi:hypothetical protein